MLSHGEVFRSRCHRRFTRDTFAAHRALDPDLQPTFDHWHRDAQRMVKEAQRKLGVIPERMVLDPQELAIWCRERGRKVDSSARAAFAAVIQERRGMH